jgi:hypothetical protein
VRGESGAVFDVDPAMVDEPRSEGSPFRSSCAPLPASAIKPSPPAPLPSWLLALGGIEGVVGIGAFALSALGLAALFVIERL